MATPDWRRQAWKLTRRRSFSVYYHEEYRWVSRTPHSSVGVDPRGPERLARYLVHEGFVAQRQLRIAGRVPYADLLRVHPQELMESLMPRGLRPVKDAERSHALRATDAMLRTLRIATGATLDAARAALLEERPSVNLSGGFVGTPACGTAGLPAINDVAVAIAALRDSGFSGRIAVVVCSPGDRSGLEDCLRAVGLAASVLCLSTLSENGTSRTVAGSRVLKELGECWEGELGAVPGDVELAFVTGTVGEAPVGTARDFEAWLSVSRYRDELLVERFHKVRSVWLPGGFYGKGAWRAFAATLHALAGEREAHIPADHPSWRLRFRAVAESMSPEVLSGSAEPSWQDVASDLGLRRLGAERFLGYYTAEGIEFVLQRYGVLSELQRLGYQDFFVELGRDAQGDRVRLLGSAGGVAYWLAECVVEIRVMDDKRVFYIHWLVVRDPLAKLDAAEACLPGQDGPGLGITEELSQMFTEAARRLALDGVALVPAWYHTAYMARRLMRFFGPKRQCRFDALLEALAGLPLAEASRLVHAGQVWLESQPYQWEADVMVGWLDGSWSEGGEESADGYSPHFTLRP